MHLEDEAFAVLEPEERRWEEKVPRGGCRIRRGDIAAGVSAVAKSQPGVEEVQGED
jgi:hypothetical protein